jgi:hypothetical protein
MPDDPPGALPAACVTFPSTGTAKPASALDRSTQPDLYATTL